MAPSSPRPGGRGPQREHLLAAVVDAVIRVGNPADVTPAAVTRAAGVPKSTFANHFESVEEGVLEAYEAAAEDALARFTAAYRDARGSWAESVRAALAALFGHLAARQRTTRMCTVEALYAGPPALRSRDRLLERFAGVLAPGCEQSPGRPSEVVVEAVCGGVFELVRIHALDERLEALPEALPDATVIALTPFVGYDEATRLAALPTPARAG